MKNSGAILLVDDNNDFVELARRAFAKSKIEAPVVVVEDGAEALDYLFARGEYADRDAADLPAVVLLDLKLPKVDGLEVLRRLRADERTQMVPVVIMTSSTEEHDLVAGYDYGTNAFIRKPVDSSRLMEVLRETGLFWSVLNELPPVKDQR